MAKHRAEDRHPTQLCQPPVTPPHPMVHPTTGVPLIRIVVATALACCALILALYDVAPADPPEPVPAAQTVAMPRCTPQVEELAVREQGRVLPAAVRREGR